MQRTPEATVDLTPSPDGVRITVHGDLDMSVAHLPAQLLAEHLEQGGEHPREVVVDLQAVDFIDSTGLGGLVRLRHEVGPTETRVVLEGANPKLRQLLAMTGLEQEFDITG